MLNSHDKLTIRMIHEQVKVLSERQSSHTDMLKILSDLVPDVKYILKAAGVKEMKLHLKESPFFSYFVRLVQGRKPRPLK